MDEIGTLDKEDNQDVTEDEVQSEDSAVQPVTKHSANPFPEPVKVETEAYMPTELTEEDEKNLTVGLPNVNCVERIIICLDLCSEMEKESFRSRAGGFGCLPVGLFSEPLDNNPKKLNNLQKRDKFSQIQIVIKALRLFVNSKTKINFEHEFALVVLDDVATWVHDFTNNPREIIALLEDMACSNKPVQDSFDISSLFDVIEDKVRLPIVDDIILPPPYVVRILFIYGRSNCLLTSTDRESQNTLEASPYVFFDSLYIHEPLADDNSCEEIFNSLCKLDKQGYSYIFEVSKNPTKLYVYMAQLLAHPLQRVAQQSTAYKLRPLTPDLEQGIGTIPLT